MENEQGDIDFEAILNSQKAEQPVEKEKTAMDLIREAERATHVELPKPTSAVVPMLDKAPVIDTSGRPNRKKLDALFKGAVTDIDCALHCKTWAKNNGNHFLGFSVKDNEPIFKKIK